MVRWFRKEKDLGCLEKKTEMFTCPACGEKCDKNWIYTCCVCGKQGCPNCGTWEFFYVYKDSFRENEIIEQKPLCSLTCEEKLIEPHIQKFKEEKKGELETLLDKHLDEVKQWFSRELGHPTFRVETNGLSRFYESYKLDRMCKQFGFDGLIKDILERVEATCGEVLLVPFTTREESIIFWKILNSRAPNQFVLRVMKAKDPEDPRIYLSLNPSKPSNRNARQ